MTIAKNVDTDLKEISKWKKIEEAGTPLTLKRFIGNREVISKAELITKSRLGVSAKTVQRDVAKGMPVHPCSTKLFQVFDWLDVLEWRDRSIDKTMSDKTRGITPSIVDNPEDINTEEVRNRSDLSRKYTADAENAELTVQLNQLKLDTAKGALVPADDLDRSMSELAVVHKTDKIHDENLLPALLQNKNVGEIKQILQEHNFERLEMLDKIINKEFKSTETMYDIVEAVLHQLKDGVEPESLVKRLNGSLV